MNVRRLNSTWDSGFFSLAALFMAESNKLVIWGLSVVDGQLGRVVDGVLFGVGWLVCYVVRLYTITYQRILSPNFVLS